MGSRPVGRRVKRTLTQREELDPGIHLVIRGSPDVWNVIGHVNNDEKITGRRKTGSEYEGSTEKSTPNEPKMAGKAGI